MRLILCTAALCCVAVPASAASILVPAGIAGEGDGNYNNNAPFASVIHQQQIFTAADFGTAPLSITGFSYRIDANTNTPTYNFTDSSFVATLSTSKTTVATFSTTFANNTGSDAQQVYAGALTLAGTRGTKLSDGTYAFDVVFTLQTPFTYDPTKGDLLLDTLNTGTITGIVPILDASNQYPTETKRLFTAQTGAATGGTSNISLVTTILASPAPVAAAVPEPSSWAMMIGGFGTVGFAMRRRRKVAMRVACAG